jgi:uncharacterized MnhB-related membrane protein
MPDAEFLFDAFVAISLLSLAWAVLASTDLFKAVVLFIAFGLLMALAWVRLGAPDIALAEAAVGAGLTGALLLDAVGQMRGDATPVARQGDDSGKAGMERMSSERRAGIGQPHRAGRIERTPQRVAVALAATFLAALLAVAALDLPADPGGLTGVVAARLSDSGVSQPVTAVLLNFRAYDTWLEVGVLLLAVLGLLAVRQAHDLSAVAPFPPPGEVLLSTAWLLLPVMAVTAGYILWLGTSGPGGAFQAGAVLGSALVLLRMAGLEAVSGVRGAVFKLLLVSGFAAFLLAGVAGLLAGNRLLELPPGHAGTLIVMIETGVAVATAFALAAMFTGGPPALRLDSAEPPGNA